MAPLDDPDPAASGDWPTVSRLGFDGLLVSFGDRLTEPANRAALALRAAVEREGWAGVEECATSLVSTYLRFDPLADGADRLPDRLSDLLGSRDWTEAPLLSGRRLWRVPTVFGGAMAPQLEESARLAGVSPDTAIEEISARPVRVQTIGFAPGMPYLGELPAHWDIPRQSGLTPRVPVGALTVAIRQLVLFTVSTPTGWRHVGQTALRLFRPESDDPFPLRPGDEVLFTPVDEDSYARLEASGPDGGATAEPMS